MLLGNNHLGNIFTEVITIKTLFASAIADCRGEFRGLYLTQTFNSRTLRGDL